MVLREDVLVPVGPDLELLVAEPALGVEEVLEALVVAGLAVGQDGTHHVQVAHVAVGPGQENTV